jgi:hypothetical protein
LVGVRQGIQDGVPTLRGLMAAPRDAGADDQVERELEAGGEARSPHQRLDKRAGLGD